MPREIPVVNIRTIALLVGALTVSFAMLPLAAQQPNVVLIMTDDQGLGDFGCTGNPLVETPNIDQLLEQSARFENFYVCPVCSPTRASLLTGRYHYRTGVVDTYIGRSMMDTAEVTLAERFQGSGYRTGIFGKWHLGDCFPMRPMDQGFDTAIVHRGGGIGQSSDPIGAEGKYTDPILFHNGKPVQESGYCTDVYYDYAIDFIETCVQQQQPFFVYLPDNCPHGPFSDVPSKWYGQYEQQDLSAASYPKVAGGEPVKATTKPDKNARVFSMISNIDQNIGRLRARLQSLGVGDNTIVIFLTDNGPNGERYTCGLRGRKTSVYEGGIRTLCLFHWPERVKSKAVLADVAAHIDITPTLIDACQLEPVTAAPTMDGTSLFPLLTGEAKQLPARNLFLQVHRGNRPQRYHHFAVRGPRFKLVHHSGFHQESFGGPPNFELFDLQQDPFEQHNISDQHPDQLSSLKQAYDNWFDRIENQRGEFLPPRIGVSPATENPLVLTRQDSFRDPNTKPKQWPQTDGWRLTASAAHSALATVYFRKPQSGNVVIVVGLQRFETRVQEATRVELPIEIPAGNHKLTSFVELGNGQQPARQAYQVQLDWEQ
jgi:arylsulfatase A-like enzyme